MALAIQNISSAIFLARFYDELLSISPAQGTQDATTIQQRSPESTNIYVFENVVAEHPEKVALVSRCGCLTYAGLNERANRLARHLISLGAGSGCVVAVGLERGLEYVVSMLACWKVGAAYLPLDQSLPANRMQFMISDSKSSCLITIKKVMNAKTLSLQAGSTVCLDDDVVIQEMATPPGTKVSTTASTGRVSKCYLDCKPSDTTAVHRVAEDDSLAYIIYTSGTTGNPKGVGITHRSLLDFVHDIRLSREIEFSDRVLLFSPLCFDASIRDINGSIMLGASLYVPEEEEILPGNLIRTIAQQRITNSVITPSVL